MRLWSIHPKYLDAKGLVALWREALLAQKVLQNKTKGYKNHPQLFRFKNSKNPVGSIGTYLEVIFSESIRRGYKFSTNKISSKDKVSKLTVTNGQVAYEWQHLLKKVKHRDPEMYRKLEKIVMPDRHPLFRLKSGEKEKWEK